MKGRERDGTAVWLPALAALPRTEGRYVLMFIEHLLAASYECLHVISAFALGEGWNNLPRKTRACWERRETKAEEDSENQPKDKKQAHLALLSSSLVSPFQQKENLPVKLRISVNDFPKIQPGLW